MDSYKLQKSFIYTGELNQDGQLCNYYAPLHNFVSQKTKLLSDFTTRLLDFDLEHPVDIQIQPAYDGAVNLVLNDGKNIPRLINSRFSVLGENQFRITDHTGFKDTNIYDETTFDVDTAIKPISINIPLVNYLGLLDNAGSVKCGAYTFYFKLADADYNETEVLAESGIIQCHVGKVNDPSSIRMGMEDELTDKAIKLQITDIDLGFDYVFVYFSRNSSGNSNALSTSFYKVAKPYPVSYNRTCNIVFNGLEDILQISADVIDTNYADIASVNAVAMSKNVLLFGNVNSSYHDWSALQQISWKIHTEVVASDDLSVGSLNYAFKDLLRHDDRQCGYYNTLNTYYRLGYWPDETYRIGIVYIFNDNSLSPVFNLQGRDLNCAQETSRNAYVYLFKNTKGTAYQEHLYEPEDYYFDKTTYLNSKGVFHLPQTKNYTMTKGSLIPKPLYFKFSLRDIGLKEFDIYEQDFQRPSWKEELQKHNIKGFFFVRQTRLPNIMCQGVMIGKTAKDFGNVPVLFNSSQSQYYFQSFLQSKDGNAFRYLVPKSNTQSGNIGANADENQCTCNALLVPDAELQTTLFNTLFCSSEYTLSLFNRLTFDGETRIRDDNFDPAMNDRNVDQSISKTALLTNITEKIKLQTDGTSYFSSMVGDASNVTDVVDIINNWNKTSPINLTASRSLIRGLWGSYVGVSEKKSKDTNDSSFTYGSVYNVKKTSSIDTVFYNYFKNDALYYTISDRIGINKCNIEDSFNCYRGDCFITMFAHRLFRNFIDPELPTNTKIVDPTCWLKNFKVRNTCKTDQQSSQVNLASSDEGFWDTTGPTFVNQVVPIWERCMYYSVSTGMSGPSLSILGNIDASKSASSDGTKSPTPTTTDADFHSCGTTKDRIARTDSQEVSPAGAVIKTLFSPVSKEWELRGTNQINRADVNAVGLGQWVIFPICSALNLAMRDVDFSNATEEAQFNRKRSFYPLSPMDQQNPLQDSNVINTAAKVSTSKKGYYGYQNTPFNKQEYHTRINYSQLDNAQSFTNGFKQLLENAYVDYPKTLGEIVKLVAFEDYVYVICKHGIGVIEVRLDAKEDEQRLSNMQVLSDMYGTMWKDSVVTTPHFIYGIDTVAKKIWQIAGNKVNIISDQKVEKFLIDNIDLSEFNMRPFMGHINVKSHYNAFKQDVIFTYYRDIPIDENGDDLANKYNIETNNWDNIYPNIKEWKLGKTWSLCWNERLQSFQSFYDWIPIESTNIDNIYFSFDKEKAVDIMKGITQSTTPITKVIDKDNLSYLEARINKHEIDPIFNTETSIQYYTLFGTVTDLNILTESILCCSKHVFFTYIYNPKGCSMKVSCNTNSIDIKEDSWYLLYFYNASSSDETCTLRIQINTNDAFINAKSTSYIKIYPYITSVNYEMITETNSVLKCDKYPYTSDTVSFRTPANSLLLWKHGQAGIYDCQGDILPTNWYGKQHEFNFEFVVKDNQPLQKIYNNLKIISNKSQPNKFEYEIVGEGYDWWPYKPIIQWINERTEISPNANDSDYWWREVLSKTLTQLKTDYDDFPDFRYGNVQQLKKLPYLNIELTDRQGRKDRSYNRDSDAWSGLGNRAVITKKDDYAFNCNETVIKYDEQLNEYRIHDEQLGNDVSKYGRIRGNMQYLEDFWNVEIRPIQFRWCYLDPTDPDESVDFYITEHCAFQSSTFPTGHLIKSSAPAGSYTIKGNFTTTGDFGGSREPLMEGCLVICKSGTFSNMSPDLQDVLRMVYNDGKILNIVALNDQEKTLSFSESIDVVFLNIDANYLDDWLKYYTDSTPPYEYAEYTDNGTFTFSVQLNCKIPPKLHFKKVETRHRDKYLKVKIRYSGEDLTVIQAIQSMFDYSYA